MYVCRKCESKKSLVNFAHSCFTARKRSLGQGNIFTLVCHSVHRGGSASVHAGIPTLPPGSRHPPGSRPPSGSRPPPLGADPPRSRHPPPGSRPPLCSACWEIRAISWRYASYWNAILFYMCLILVGKDCTFFISPI